MASLCTDGLNIPGEMWVPPKQKGARCGCSGPAAAKELVEEFIKAEKEITKSVSGRKMGVKVGQRRFPYCGWWKICLKKSIPAPGMVENREK